MNIPVLCGNCHKEGAPVARVYNIMEKDILTNYSQSIHGEGLFKGGLFKFIPPYNVDQRIAEKIERRIRYDLKTNFSVFNSTFEKQATHFTCFGTHTNGINFQVLFCG